MIKNNDKKTGGGLGRRKKTGGEGWGGSRRRKWKHVCEETQEEEMAGGRRRWTWRGGRAGQGREGKGMELALGCFSIGGSREAESAEANIGGGEEVGGRGLENVDFAGLNTFKREQSAACLSLQPQPPHTHTSPPLCCPPPTSP